MNLLFRILDAGAVYLVVGLAVSGALVFLGCSESACVALSGMAATVSSLMALTRK